MIFWGVLVLTLFGWLSSILESVFEVFSIFFNFVGQYMDAMSQYGQVDERLVRVQNYYDNTAMSMRLCEIFTIVGWVLYVVGLSKFKKSQISGRAYRLTGSLNTACWLGLSSMVCYFLAGFLGMLGFLFRFIGWVLILISLFKFRSAFDSLSWEKTWNKPAREGAKNLRLSYTLALVLMFFPLICGLVIFFVVLGGVGNMGTFFREFADYGPGVVAQYAAGVVGIIVLLALIGLVMWILKFVYLLLGWNRISNGKLYVASVPSDDEVFPDEEEDDEDEMDGEEEDTGDDDDDDDSNSKWIIVGATAGGVLLIVLIFWLCFGGNSTLRNDNSAATADSTEFAKADSANETEIEQEPELPELVDEDVEFSAPESEEPAGDEYTHTYAGTIDNKHRIEMTLTTDGGAYYRGEYFYTNKNVPIQLSGRLTDDNVHLVLEEYVGMEKTGMFDGTLTDTGYSGVWTSADGETTLPFVVRIKQ